MLLQPGSEPPADLMDSVDCLSNGSESFLSKLGAIGMLLWYFPGFLWRNPVRKGVERVERVVRHIRQQATAAGQVRVAVQGYCWGGRIAVLLAGSHPDLVDVICAAHPGGLTLPTDVDRVQIPAAFVLAGNDSTVKAPQIKLIEEAMEKKSFDHQVNSL
jgi:dienelactone hydrolase